ncbi:hypothetical protein HMPREF3171_11105 [Corynebacterium sp. HMSC08F01]|nr:hypothetical protein HMPREF3171_11105 [Corynebacterium sp. HMSC08F01]
MSATSGAVGVARESGIVSPDYATFRPKKGENSDFLSFLIGSRDFIETKVRPLLRGIGVGSDGGVRTPRVNSSDLLGIKAWIPSFDQQSRIASYLEKEIGEMEALIEEFETLKRDLENRRSIVIDSVLENTDRIPLGYFINEIRTGMNPRQNFTLSPAGAEGYYITVRELKGKRIEIDDSTVRIGADAVAMIQERTRLIPGDLLFCGTGSIGKTAIVSETPTNWGMKEGIYALTPTPGKLDTHYLFYALSSSRTKKEIALDSLGSTVASISTEKLLRVTIPYHSYEKQQELTAELDREFGRMEALAEESTKLIESLKARKTALITEVVTGRKEV